MPTSTREKLWHLTDTALHVRVEDDLPPGIAGRVSGVALTYEVIDSYQTMFSRKCAKRSIDGRVAARKVPLLMDHERTETDLLILAARVALDALSESDRHAVLSRYQPETRSETATVVTPAVTTTPTSTASTARYATLEERTTAVRSTFIA